jgi:MerR family transcriptional regulator, light-induced transcriptional regulator
VLDFVYDNVLNMPYRSPPQSSLRTIAEVELDTGLGKDALRVWERRYGFPAPTRDAGGQRLYTQAEVERLRQIASLLRAGHRPGRVVALGDDEREALLKSGPATAAVAVQGGDTQSAETSKQTAAIAAAMVTLAAREGSALRRQLQQSLAALGLAAFVVELMAPLATEVGLAWLRGDLQVADEHLFTEVAQNVLRQGLLTLPEPPADAAPRVLLTTLPGEPHGLGLLMAEAMLALQGARCINLGPQTPIDEIVAAAGWHHVQIVGLSATGCLPVRGLRQSLSQLRQRLDRGTALWLGGSAADGLRGVSGVVTIADLRLIQAALAGGSLATKGRDDGRSTD